MRGILKVARRVGVDGAVARKSRHPVMYCRLHVEPLEDRRVLSAASIFSHTSAPTGQADNVVPLTASISTAAATVDFVTALYQKVLERAPDPSGLAFYTNLLATGTQPSAVVAYFWESAEHRGIEVDSYYQQYFGRAADPGGRQFWVQTMLAGVTEETVIVDFLVSPEYQQLHPVTASSGQTGNFYVSYAAGTDASTVHEFSTTGADLGIFASAGLAGPAGLAFDASGNLYVASSGNNTIHKFGADGADLGVFASAGLNVPTGLAFDSQGNLYVSNDSNNTIRKFSPTGADLGVFATTDFHSLGLAIDSSDNVYEEVNNAIRKFGSDGSDLGTFANTVGYGLAFDNADNLYVSNNDQIHKFGPAGADLGVFAAIGLGFLPALGITFDGGGNLFVVATGRNQILKFDPTGGNMRTFATLAVNAHPLWIAVSPIASNFVTGLYQDILKRAPDPDGLAYYTNLLATGTPLSTVVSYFWESAEHRGIEVDDYYQTCLGRAADPGGRQFWVQELLAGVAEETVITKFFISEEFIHVYPLPPPVAGPNQVVVTVVGDGYVTDTTGQIDTRIDHNVATYGSNDFPFLHASSPLVTWSDPSFFTQDPPLTPNDFANGLNITAFFD